MYLNVTLCPQVVDFSGLHFIDDFYKACAVGEVPVVQLHICNQELKLVLTVCCFYQVNNSTSTLRSI